MATTAHRGIIDDPDTFDAYCTRHAVSPDAAVAELANMALGLPADILDYVRGQRSDPGAAA